MAKRAKKNQQIRGLIIDDNYDFYLAVARTLQGKVETEYASDSFSAMRLLQSEKFDIVLCDIFMPVLDGVAFLVECRKSNLQVPFIMISGNPEGEMVTKALHWGAYNVLQKPFSADQLLDKIQQALDIHQSEEIAHNDDQERAFVFNALKMHYYDVDRIMRLIQQHHIPMSVVTAELQKKEATGSCIFDDLHGLKYFNRSA